jgi:mRNA-degrading endonuclease RelE of RelBE toxin-antitoxin system
MKTCERYAIVYASQVKQHLQVIERKHHSLIRQTIEQQLTFEPLQQTRNRKPVYPPAPFSASWEIRFGPANRFRVFYDVNLDECEVDVLAIGEKVGNRLSIGGQVVGREEDGG